MKSCGVACGDLVLCSGGTVAHNVVEGLRLALRVRRDNASLAMAVQVVLVSAIGLLCRPMPPVELFLLVGRWVSEGLTMTFWGAVVIC